MKSRFLVFSLLLTGAMIAVAAVILFASRPSAGTDIPTLRIFCFQGYTEPEWVNEFEQTHDCQIRYTYTSTIEEMFRKTKENPRAFDLLSLDQGRITLYRSADLLQPVDTSLLDNYQSIRNFFSRQMPRDSTNTRVYHVPIVWGTQTLTVNTEKVHDTVIASHLGPDSQRLSLDILTDPRLQGHTAFFDEAANIFAIAGIHCGVDDPHDLSPEEWEMVTQRVYEWAQNASTYTTGLFSEFNTLVSGDTRVLLGGNDALLIQRLDNAGISHKFAQYPSLEGTYCWIDGWAITKMTRGIGKKLAYEYIDFMISEQGQRLLATHVGFGPVNASATDALADATKNITYWYAQDIENFPGKLVFMSQEEDPFRRMRTWERIKEHYNE